MIAVARTQSKLIQLNNEEIKPELLVSDVTTIGFPDLLLKQLDGRKLSGIVINAGGPPAGGFFDIADEAWQSAFENILQWKIRLLKSILPVFRENNYGRIVIIESVSVKQPVDGLILSNSLRAAVAGMAATLATEVAPDGITVNLLAPGYHNTAAMQRLFDRKQAETGGSLAEIRQIFESETKVGKMGNPDDLAGLASWLLSPESGFVTGQVITVAGNQVKGIFG